MQNRHYFLTALTAGMMTISLTAAPVFAESEEPAKKTGFSLCDSYVYVYSDMDRDSEIVGKLYTDSYVDILDELEYDWTYISSGNVVGYVDSTAIKKGKKARKIAKESAYITAEVLADEVAVHAKRNTDSGAIATVNTGDVLEVVKLKDDWVKVVLVGEDGNLIYGWIVGEYVNVRTEYRLAVTLEEDELGLIDIGEGETEAEGDDEEYYEDDGSNSYQEPTYTQPTYTQPTYTQPTYTQPDTSAPQPQTEAPQRQTEAPSKPATPDDGVADDPSGDDIYIDDGSGSGIYDDDIFDDSFYDAD